MCTTGSPLLRGISFGEGRRRVTSLGRTFACQKKKGALASETFEAGTKPSFQRTFWNIHMKKDSLWIQWIQSEYLGNESIWEASAHKDDSTLFKELLDIRDEMFVKATRPEIEKLWESWAVSKGTAAAYEWFRPKGERRFWAKFVWKDFIPPKFSFTTWRALRGRLRTRDSLHFLNIADTCPICSRQGESVDHLFFSCEKTVQVWNDVKSWLKLTRSLTTIKSAIKWIARESKGPAVLQKAKKIALAATVDLIWKARNNLVFEKRPFEVRKIVFDIKKATYTLLYSLYPYELVTSSIVG